MERARIIVYGWVQGVFFRQNAKSQAEKLGVFGWVRNNPDGTVEIIAEGERKQLEELVAWCQKGPPFAHIDKVDVSWQKVEGGLDTFEIVY